MSSVRSVFIESQVTAIFLIVAEVIPYKPGEMPFAKDDDVLEELSTAAADPALGGSV